MGGLSSEHPKALCIPLCYFKPWFPVHVALKQHNPKKINREQVSTILVYIYIYISVGFFKLFLFPEELVKLPQALAP